MGITRLDQDYVRRIAEDVNRYLLANDGRECKTVKSIYDSNEPVTVDYVDYLQHLVDNTIIRWRTAWHVSEIDSFLFKFYYAELTEVLRNAKL